MKPDTAKIRFHYVDVCFSFPQRNALKAFLLKQLKKEGKTVEAINYIFCTDEYLLHMNRHYLQHDTLTDIISFELSEKGKALLADIFISVERVRENAGLFRTGIGMELKRVIFHGALHLAGYGDKTAGEKKRMRDKEEEWLNAFAVSRNTVSG